MTRNLRCRGRRRPHIYTTVSFFFSLPFAYSTIPQHRVQRAFRDVPYASERPGVAEVHRFWIPDSKSLSTEKAPKSTLRSRAKESSPTKAFPGATQQKQANEDDVVWHLHLDASHPDTTNYLHDVERRHGKGVDRSPKSRVGRRRAQVNEKFTPDEGAGHNQSDGVAMVEETDEYNSTSGLPWNVSTEVEYGDPTSTTTQNGTNTSSVLVTTNNGIDNETSAEYRPMRIRIILSDQNSGGKFLNDTERRILFENLLSPATVAWSSALRVKPVVGNLTVDREQLHDGVSCGPGIDSGHPSVVVPEAHFDEGLPATDFVVYLSLGYAPRKPEDEQPGGASDLVGDRPTATPTEQALTSHDQPKYIPLGSSGDASSSDVSGFPDPSGNGGDNAQFYEQIENVTDIDSDLAGHEKPQCTGEYLAAATFCSTDQYDRPTTAMLHICIGHDFFEQDSVKANIVTVMHELGHALGFNLHSMAHFRDEDGAPITQRDENGNVPEVQVECTGPTEARGLATIPLPSDKILQFHTVRGGVRVANVATPSVKQVVRNHFDCQRLEGAELESGSAFGGDDSDLTSCIGSHWERRLFRTDLMNPIVTEVPFVLRISPITLALFADSGWYQVDLSRVSYAAGWGRAAGCSFVNETCIDEAGRVSRKNQPFFCNNYIGPQRRGTVDEIQGCSPDLTSKASCTMEEYETELPGEYQYFSSTLGSNVGGDEPFIDFCPVYKGFSNGDCKNAENEVFLGLVSGEDFGSRNSRCLAGVISQRRAAFCLQIACVVEDQTLFVKVDDTWHTCEKADEELGINSGSWTGKVFCPDPIRTCPTFYCHRDCLGTGGTCDYDTGECVCASDNLGSLAAISGRCSNSTREDPAILDSPLGDYYVPSTNDLDGYRRPRHEILVWVTSAVVACLALVVGFFLMKWNGWFQDCKWRFWISHAQESLSEQQQLDGQPRANNKDKFVATLLFHIRVHDPIFRNPSEAETASHTAAETEVSERGPPSDLFGFSESESDKDNDERSVVESEPDIKAEEEEEDPHEVVQGMRRRVRAG